MDLSVVVARQAEGDWLKVSGQEDVEVKVKTITPRRLREIRRRCTKQKMVRSRLVETVDDEQLNRLLLHEVVLDWRGLTKDGAEFPCNEANREYLDDNWFAFSSLWNQEIAKALRVSEEIQDAELKN